MGVGRAAPSTQHAAIGGLAFERDVPLRLSMARLFGLDGGSMFLGSNICISKVAAGKKFAPREGVLWYYNLRPGR
jgi:hypothetical protein